MARSVTSSGLFVKQPSGLVRNVSMTNALFFNIAAFVGTAVGWAVVFYALFPEWQGLGISAYAWMAILTGIACFFLGLIFSNLADLVMFREALVYWISLFSLELVRKLLSSTAGQDTYNLDDMVNELACRMFTDLALSGSVRWRATATFSMVILKGRRLVMPTSH